MAQSLDTWWLVQLTPEAAEAHDRRVHNVPDGPNYGLGWKPYTYRATRGAVSQWACHEEWQLAQKLRAYGLRIVEWREWSEGVRIAEAAA